MKTFLIVSLATITVIALIVYSFFNSNKTPDLNVKKSNEIAYAKLDSLDIDIIEKELNDIKPEDSIINGEPKDVNTRLNASQASSIIDLWSSVWAYAPLSDSKVVIGDDNTVEYTGVFNVDKALGYASATGISKTTVDAVRKFIKPLGQSFPIYGKGKIEIENNNVNVNFSKANVGIIPIPSDMLKKYKGNVDSFVEQQLSQDSKYTVNTFKVEDGEFVIDAVLPQTVSYYK